MSHIMVFAEDDTSIGLMTRKATPGPEIDMVKYFADFMIEDFKRVKAKNTRLAIFFEPMLDVGFPDIVLAEYSVFAFKKWQQTRQDLQMSDFKILHHILHVKGANAKEIQAQLGIDSKALIIAIERLLDAGLIRRNSRQWQAVNLENTFGLKRLIAVEAKLANNLSVFHQAQSNRWFASESYVLFPATKPTMKALERSEQFGVGVYVLSGREIKQAQVSPIQDLPTCYGSWLFNEWVGRKLQSVVN